MNSVYLLKKNKIAHLFYCFLIYPKISVSSIERWISGFAMRIWPGFGRILETLSATMWCPLWRFNYTSTSLAIHITTLFDYISTKSSNLYYKLYYHSKLQYSIDEIIGKKKQVTKTNYKLIVYWHNEGVFKMTLHMNGWSKVRWRFWVLRNTNMAL